MIDARLIKDGAFGNKSKLLIKTQGVTLGVEIGLGMADGIGLG
jgi:hypothetical protein